MPEYAVARRPRPVDETDAIDHESRVAGGHLVVAGADDPAEIDADRVAAEVVARLGATSPLESTAATRIQPATGALAVARSTAVEPRIRRSSGLVIQRAPNFATWRTNTNQKDYSKESAKDAKRIEFGQRKKYYEFLQAELTKVPRSQSRPNDKLAWLNKIWNDNVGAAKKYIEELLGKSPRELVDNEWRDLRKTLDALAELHEHPEYDEPLSDEEQKKQDEQARLKKEAEAEAEKKLRAELTWSVSTLAAKRQNNSAIEKSPEGALSEVLLWYWDKSSGSIGYIVAGSTSNGSSRGGSKADHAERPALQSARSRITQKNGTILGIVISTTYTPCQDDRTNKGGGSSCWSWYATQKDFFNGLKSPYGQRPPVVVHGYKDWDVKAGNFELTVDGELQPI